MYIHVGTVHTLVKGVFTVDIIVVFHSAGMFYFLLGNLHPMYWSKLKSIQLVALCKHRYIKKYSIHSVLAPFVEDMKKLVSDTLMYMYVHIPVHIFITTCTCTVFP